MTPREDFLVSMFQDDPRLVEMFHEAETKRFQRKETLVKIAAWIGMAAVSTVIWVGVIKAIGAW